MFFFCVVWSTYNGNFFISKSKFLKHLTSLNLYYNRIQDEGCKYIAVSDNLVSLRNLNLSNNEIGDEGALMLARFLPLFTNLLRLDIRFNRLREDGKRTLLDIQKHTTIKQFLLDNEEGFNVQERGMKKNNVWFSFFYIATDLGRYYLFNIFVFKYRPYISEVNFQDLKRLA